jgi:hypothetical protein
VDRALEEQVWARARFRCEYCLLPVGYTEAPFQIDHIIAKKHGGETVAANLALSCYFCNSYKGPNIASLDPSTGKLVRLFHPRKDRWADHFAWEGPLLVGQTAIGRATTLVLWINHPLVVETRRLLIAEGDFPPS